MTDLQNSEWISVPIHDSILAQEAMEFVQAENPRKKNIDSALPKVSDKFFWKEHSFRYKGKYSGYVSSSLIPCYSSFVKVSKNGDVAQLWQRNKLIRVKLAPKGMKWSTDKFGAKLVDSKGYDYHPTVQDFKGSLVKNARIAISKKKNSDRYNAKLEKIRKIAENPRKLAKFWVTKEDSLKSGNCVYGTDQFISRIENIMGKVGAIRADFLMQKFDSPYVKRAIYESIKRKVLTK